MSTKSLEVGKAVLHGIDTLESGAHDAVHAGAVGARHATQTSSRWAARQEASAIRKARMLKSDLKRQATQVSRSLSHSAALASAKAKQAALASDRYVKRKPWTAIAIASGAALLLGAFLGRRRA